jgi:hypothetical protein
MLRRYGEKALEESATRADELTAQGAGPVNRARYNVEQLPIPDAAPHR